MMATQLTNEGVETSPADITIVAIREAVSGRRQLAEKMAAAPGRYRRKLQVSGGAVVDYEIEVPLASVPDVQVVQEEVVADAAVSNCCVLPPATC
eukprot:SAG31_NODE_244_length_19246_cov_20.233823_8_plen_95_part_00